MLSDVFNTVWFRWGVSIAIASIACYLIPEAIFLLKHKKNDSGLEPDKCVEYNHHDEFYFDYPDWRFNVLAKFIPNSPKNCLCPDFPAIKLEGTNQINSWIQVVETDSSNNELNWFVDSHSSDSPFYNRLKYMSDSPNWGGFGYYYRFSTYFKARAYPTVINEDQSVDIYPPIQWGFSSEHLQFSLVGIAPTRITDYQVIQHDIERMAQNYPHVVFKIAQSIVRP